MVQDVERPVEDSRLGRATKDVLFGSIAGTMSKLLEHPFDLIKVRLQTQPQIPHYTGAYDCFRKILQHDGVPGLFRGVSMPMIGATLENAALFLTYNQIQALLSHLLRAKPDTQSSLTQVALAGAGAGAVASCVLTPVELIKCKMQVQTMKQGTASSLVTNQDASSLIRQTVREQGVRGLWVGFLGTLLRETGGGSAWFLAFEMSTRELLHLRNKHHRADLTSVELAACGALAGISYNVSLYPADCVKSTMQTERELKMHHSTKRQPTGFFRTLTNIYHARGLRGLYAGLGVTCLRSAPSSGKSLSMLTNSSCIVCYIITNSASCTTNSNKLPSGMVGRFQ